MAASVVDPNVTCLLQTLVIDLRLHWNTRKVSGERHRPSLAWRGPDQCGPERDAAVPLVQRLPDLSVSTSRRVDPRGCAEGRLIGDQFGARLRESSLRTLTPPGLGVLLVAPCDPPGGQGEHGGLTRPNA